MLWLVTFFCDSKSLCKLFHAGTRCLWQAESMFPSRNSHLVQNKFSDASWTKSYGLHQQLWQPSMKPQGWSTFTRKVTWLCKGFLVPNRPRCQLTLVSFFWGRDSLLVWSLANWFIQGWFGVSWLFPVVVLTVFVLLVFGLFLLPSAQHSTLHLCGSSVRVPFLLSGYKI